MDGCTVRISIFKVVKILSLQEAIHLQGDPLKDSRESLKKIHFRCFTLFPQRFDPSGTANQRTSELAGWRKFLQTVLKKLLTAVTSIYTAVDRSWHFQVWLLGAGVIFNLRAFKGDLIRLCSRWTSVIETARGDLCGTDCSALLTVLFHLSGPECVDNS